MTNQDLIKALEELADAAQRLEEIMKLPTEIGARVKWLHNGVIWRRVGSNDWVPEPDEKQYLVSNYMVPSTHIIAQTFEVI